MARQDDTQRAFLSNEQLKKLTGWDRNMIEDYQGIQRDTTLLFDDADTFERDIDENTNNIASALGLIGRLNSLVSEFERRIDELDQLASPQNIYLSKIEELNKRLNDLEQLAT